MAFHIIPTEYKGLQYRSRTEARWAVVFDQLGWAFHYEPEGFDLPIGWYLPDFYLPDIKTYFEVKAKEPNYEERRKAAQLCEATLSTVVISTSPPNPNRSELDDDIVTFVPEMIEDDKILAYDYRGGFVSRRWHHHPSCSLSLGNLEYKGAVHEIAWRDAFLAAANERFGVYPN